MNVSGLAIRGRAARFVASVYALDDHDLAAIETLRIDGSRSYF